jgi:hypothetical protein
MRTSRGELLEELIRELSQAHSRPVHFEKEGVLLHLKVLVIGKHVQVEGTLER